MGVLRTGSASSPMSRPASAPMVTGVYGGLKVVVPTEPISTPSCLERIAMALTLAVLPWSVPMPVVV